MFRLFSLQNSSRCFTRSFWSSRYCFQTEFCTFLSLKIELSDSFFEQYLNNFPHIGFKGSRNCHLFLQTSWMIDSTLHYVHKLFYFRCLLKRNYVKSTKLIHNSIQLDDSCDFSPTLTSDVIYILSSSLHTLWSFSDS